MIDLLKQNFVVNSRVRKSFLDRLVSFFASVADACMVSAMEHNDRGDFF